MPVDTLHTTADTLPAAAPAHVADSTAGVPAAPDTAQAGSWVPRPGVLSADTLILTEAQGPASAAERAVMYMGKVGYYSGVPCIPRQPLAGYDSGVMAVVIGVFLVMALNFRHYSTFLKTFWSNIFSTRRRANVFDERATVSEARVIVSLVLMLCLGEGILLYTALNIGRPAALPPFAAIMALTLTAMIYYIWQLCAYRLTGYVFTTRRRAVSWFKGFTSSQALLGMMLAPVAMLALFLPSLGTILAATAAACYLGARLLFVIKGFRIFYHNSLSLVYFILYLCSLEIIPLIFIYKIASFISFSL